MTYFQLFLISCKDYPDELRLFATVCCRHVVGTQQQLYALDLCEAYALGRVSYDVLQRARAIAAGSLAAKCTASVEYLPEVCQYLYTLAKHVNPSCEKTLQIYLFSVLEA